MPPYTARSVNPSPPTRAHVLTLARTWIGTPYHHQASVPGIGCDCVGLVRGVYRALYGNDAEATAPYTRDWAEATGEETLIAAARRHLIEIDAAAAQPGDVLIFRYRPHMIAKHTAILSHFPLSPHSALVRGEGRGEGQLQAGSHRMSADDFTFIHALEGAPVSEVPFHPWWQRRIAAAFAFPGISV